MASKVPLLVHQTWKSKAVIPTNFSHWRNSIVETNPDLEIITYDDHDNRVLIQETFPQLLHLYDSFPEEIFRVDLIRCLYLFIRGGIYSDMDFQFLRNLTPLMLPDFGIILGKMGTDQKFPHSFPNAFMASTPNQAFWLGYLHFIETAWLHKPIDARPEYITGPVILRKTFLAYKQDQKRFVQGVVDFIERHDLPINLSQIEFDIAAAYPGHVFYPINWADNIHREYLESARSNGNLLGVEEAARMFPASYAVTYWTHSW